MNLKLEHLNRKPSSCQIPQQFELFGMHIVSSVFLDTQSEHKSKIIHPFQESEIGTILLVAQEPMMQWTNGEYRSIQHIK